MLTDREVLEQPGPHDVGGHFRENSSLLVPLLLFVWVVIVSRAGRGHTVVQAVTWRERGRKRERERIRTTVCLLLKKKKTKGNPNKKAVQRE